MPSLSPAEIHPLIVHFPIALLVTSFVFDILAILLRRWSLVYGATWLQAFGVVGALAAGLSGHFSEPYVADGARAMLEQHQLFGFATGFVFGMLLILRLVWLSPILLEALSSYIPSVTSLQQGIIHRVPTLSRVIVSPTLIGVYMAGSTVGLVLLTMTGYLGGKMVYFGK